MKVGDLVCYNAAGQKNKSLALVVNLHDSISKHAILLEWIVHPKLYPKTSPLHWDLQMDLCSIELPLVRRWEDLHIKPTWYKIGPWLEMVKTDIICPGDISST